MWTIFQDKYIQIKPENLKVLLINAKKHFTIKSHILLPWDKYKGRNETIAGNINDEGSCVKIF